MKLGWTELENSHIFDVVAHLLSQFLCSIIEQAFGFVHKFCFLISFLFLQLAYMLEFPGYQVKQDICAIRGEGSAWLFYRLTAPATAAKKVFFLSFFWRFGEISVWKQSRSINNIKKIIINSSWLSATNLINVNWPDKEDRETLIKSKNNINLIIVD